MCLVAEISGVSWCISDWWEQLFWFFLSHPFYFYKSFSRAQRDLWKRHLWETKENLFPWPVDVLSAVPGCSWPEPQMAKSLLLHFQLCSRLLTYFQTKQRWRKEKLHNGKERIEWKIKKSWKKKNQQHLDLILQTGPVLHCVCWDGQVLQEMVPVLQPKLKNRQKVEKRLGKGPVLKHYRTRGQKKSVWVLIEPVFRKTRVGKVSGQLLASSMSKK